MDYLYLNLKGGKFVVDEFGLVESIVEFIGYWKLRILDCRLGFIW